MRSFHFLSCLSICLMAGCFSHKEMITYLNYRLEPVKKRKAEIFMVEDHQVDLLIRQYHRKESGAHYLTRTYRSEEDDLHCIREERFYPDGTLQYQYTLKGEGYQIGPQVEWHPNGQLKQEYVSPGQEGYWRRWYPNGQLQLRFHYRKGERQGWQSYWNKEGTLLYQRYEGEVVEGNPEFEITRTPFEGPEASQESFDTPPRFSNRVCEGDFLGFNYPKIAREAGIMGTIYFWVYVDEIGQVLDYQIQKSIHPFLDNSVIRRAFNCGYEPGSKAQIPTSGWILQRQRFSTPY